MWASDRPSGCSECGQTLRALEDLGGFCTLCGQIFCRHHLVIRKGVPNCAACEELRRRKENEGAVSPAEVERVVRLIGNDLLQTIGAGRESIAEEAAARIQLFCDDLGSFEQRVVDDVQQSVHDDFVDTSWPACEEHPNHPLWYSDGWWRCELLGRRVAPLGRLRRGAG